ncbi:MAG TPA: Gfo/Idh/MocA family oxidoreductase [Planctomycetota bacterium]|nr:Gfo/Idh/MocA family oxidoreductase [Planctomycetota bacterium]
MGKLRVGVVGVGHLGQHHARIYAGLDDVELVGVADKSAKRAEEVAARHGVPFYGEPTDLIGRADAVSVATPTEFHHAIASKYLEAGIPCLVEKPMCKTVEEARALVEIAKRKQVPLQIGHIERFNPAVVAIKPMIEDPRFISCDRISPFSFRSADVGVVLDLMIHDLDIVLHFCKSPVVNVEATGVPVIAKTEDIAYARLKFEDGAMAVLNTSRVSIKKMRKIRIFQRHGYISLDYDARQALVYKKRPGFEFGEADLKAIDTTQPPEALQAIIFSKFLELEHVSMEAEEPLKLELASFVDAVRNGKEPVVPGEAGLRAMVAADQIVASLNAAIESEKARLRGPRAG